MHIRLIAVDLDGTLLADDHITVSRRNREALHRARQAGAEIVLASGRTLGVMQNVLSQVPDVTYALVANGASAVEVPSGRVLFYEGIPWAVWEPVYRLLAEHRAAFEIYCEGPSVIEWDELANFYSPELPRELCEELQAHIVPVENLLGGMRGKAIEKIHVFHTPPQAYEALRRALSRQTALAVTSSMKGNFEINGKTTNKGRGLALLCEKLGIGAQQVMAFGDADNDLEMLAWAGWSYAMENAAAPVKEAAGRQAPSNAEDGVAQVVERWLRMRER